MTRKEVLERITATAMKLYDENEALSIAHLLMEHLYGVCRLDIAIEPNLECEETEELEIALKDIERGRPIQYITGKSHFYGYEFSVEEGVLIPRPETEELVDWIVDGCVGKQCQNLLDVGTGSGAIAISLAKSLAESSVVGIDISQEALEVASRNAEELDVGVIFESADVLASRSDWSGGWSGRRYDIVVSNPPYIPVTDRDKMHQNVVGHEPHSALFVDSSDPLVFYRAIARVAKVLLHPRGWLYFEIYELLGSEVVELLEREGYIDIELKRDVNDKERMVKCRKR